MYRRHIVSFQLLLIILTYWHWQPLPCKADIYKYVDKRGVIHFTNIPTHEKYTLIIPECRTSRKSCKEYDPIISYLCKKHNVDEALVKAIIKAESDFDPAAVSKKGAQGLMQLMPETAQDLDVSNPFHPGQNLDGGIRYLRRLIDQFQGNLHLALAAYNAGENAVLKYNTIPPYEETRTYVKKVLHYLRDFQGSP